MNRLSKEDIERMVEAKKFNDKAESIIPNVLINNNNNNNYFIDPKEIFDKLNNDNLIYIILTFYNKLKLCWNHYINRKDFCPININWDVNVNTPTFNCKETLKLYKYCNTNGNYLNTVIKSIINYYPVLHKSSSY